MLVGKCNIESDLHVHVKVSLGFVCFNREDEQNHAFNASFGFAILYQLGQELSDLKL